MKWPWKELTRAVYDVAAAIREHAEKTAPACAQMFSVKREGVIQQSWCCTLPRGHGGRCSVVIDGVTWTGGDGRDAETA